MRGKHKNQAAIELEPTPILHTRAERLTAFATGSFLALMVFYALDGSADSDNQVDALVQPTYEVPSTVIPSSMSTSTTYLTAEVTAGTAGMFAPPPPAELPQIVDALGEQGLTVVPDPEAINLPPQIMVTPEDLADPEACVTQFTVALIEPGIVNVSAALAGPQWGMTDREMYDQDGTQRGVTQHSEDIVGTDFPVTDQLVEQVVAHLDLESAEWCAQLEPAP